MRRGLTTAAALAAAAAFALPLGASADHRTGHTKEPAAGGNLTIAASQVTVRWPKRITISGKLSGRDAAGRTIQLRQNPHPYRGFRRVTSTQTDAKGEYSFRVRPDLHTRYRTVALRSRFQSPELQVRSRLLITRSVSDRTPERGEAITVSGTVGPAHDGGTVLIQRRYPRRWATVGRAALVDAGLEKPWRSAYSHERRVYRDSVFRVVMRSDADHLWNRSWLFKVDVG